MSNKQSLTIEDVKHIAKLANLSLTDEEIQKFQKQLTGTLHYIQKLQEIDTKNVNPTAQVTGLANVFRKDLVKPSLTQEEALANAPRKHNGYFVVDAILEE